jgi:hypothetical protein
MPTIITEDDFKEFVVFESDDEKCIQILQNIYSKDQKLRNTLFKKVMKRKPDQLRRSKRKIHIEVWDRFETDRKEPKGWPKIHVSTCDMHIILPQFKTEDEALILVAAI